MKTLRVIEDSPRTQATNHEHTTTTTITTTTLGELPGTSSPLSEVQVSYMLVTVSTNSTGITTSPILLIVLIVVYYQLHY